VRIIPFVLLLGISTADLAAQNAIAPQRPCRKVPARSTPEAPPGGNLDRDTTFRRIRAIIRSADSSASGFVVARVDPTTRRGSIYFVDLTIPAEIREKVSGIMSAFLNRRNRVGVSVVDVPELAKPWDRTLPEYTVCDPRVSNRREMDRTIAALVDAHPDPAQLTTDRHARFWFFVRPDGTTAFGVITASSGDAFIDEQIIDIATDFRFLPYTFEGQPWYAWGEMPITVLRRR